MSEQQYVSLTPLDGNFVDGDEASPDYGKTWQLVDSKRGLCAPGLPISGWVNAPSGIITDGCWARRPVPAENEEAKLLKWLQTREGSIISSDGMSTVSGHIACVQVPKHPGCRGTHYYYGATCLEALREAKKADAVYEGHESTARNDREAYVRWMHYKNQQSVTTLNAFLAGAEHARNSK